MAKVKIKVTRDDIAKANEGGNGEFDLPKPGLYVIKCGECTPGYSKGEDDRPDHSRPYLQFVYRIVGEGREEAKPKGNYGNLWDYMSFSESSGWKRAQVLKAFGINVPDDSDFTYEGDTDEDFLERKVLARIKHEKGRTKDDPPRAKIAALYQLDADLSMDGDGGDVDYGNDTEEAPKAETGVFDGGDEEQDPFTREELEEMDLKALGAILRDEFEVDPSSLVVKNSKGKTDSAKTKEAVIARILEEQGEPDAEADDEGDEDDPF